MSEQQKAGELIKLFPSEETPDGELVRQLGYGKERAGAALRVLYRRHAKPVLSFARGQLSGDEHAAQDVVQEAFVRLVKDAPAPGPKLDVRSWLLSAAYFRCQSVIEKLEARSESAPADGSGAAIPDHRAGPEEEARWKEARRTLGALIDAFPTDWKAVYRLRTEQGLGYEEIAGIMRCSVITAKRHYKAAVDRIEELAQQMGVTRD